ncbi:hypothetical protein ATANTOWER_020201 [Ataeniobius toweri]|uniref:Secreted protein n=1 Tax=Ataeniobius toweri TaxID=208326 RepID=A0ABU7AZN3_9TELE|nr:hypothetical protein [Ataeniobius toweri]
MSDPLSCELLVCVDVSLSSLLQGVTGRCCSAAAGHQAVIRRNIKSSSILEADVRLILLTSLSPSTISSHFLLWTPERIS